MDQIANMINMIKNGNFAEKESVLVPYSNIKNSIAELLVREKYISSVSKKVRKGTPMLEIGLLYVDNRPKIKGVERVSKSSRRVYTGVKSIKPTLSGFGLSVLSTPKGILTDKEARKEMVGGEILFKIW